jgi:seryl-tRNA synthetase
MTYDLEASGAPGVGAWLEVSSCSNFTDYQARRANIRTRPAKGEKREVSSHTSMAPDSRSRARLPACSSIPERRTATVTFPPALRPVLR